MGFQKSMATHHSGTHLPSSGPVGVSGRTRAAVDHKMVENVEQCSWQRFTSNLGWLEHPEEVSWHASTHSVSYNLLSNRSQSPSIGLTLDRRNLEGEAFALEASAGSATQQEMLVGFCPSHLGICPKIESCPYGFYMIILMYLLDLGPRDFLSSLPALMSCFKTLLSQQNTSFDNSVTDTPIS